MHNYLRFYTIVIAALLSSLILMTIGCQYSPSQQTNGLAYLTFSIDSTALDTLYENISTGFAFCPPKGWQTIDTSHNESMKEIFMATGLREHHDYIKQAFWDEKDQNLGLLYVYPSAKDSLLQYIIAEPDTFFNYHQEWAGVQAAPFRTGDFLIYQFLMFNETRVYFSLLFIEPTQQPFRMDYLMSKDYYQHHIRAVESSIGSFYLLTL